MNEWHGYATGLQVLGRGKVVATEDDFAGLAQQASAYADPIIPSPA